MAKPLSSRRIATGNQIQSAALTLAARDGLDAVTVDAIAREAGISVRTFFNYYPIKEAALFGPDPHFSDAAIDRFVHGRGRLIDDVVGFIRDHMARYHDRRWQVAAMVALANADARVMAQLRHLITTRHAALVRIMRQRMPDASALTLELLASAVIVATTCALDKWSGEPTLTTPLPDLAEAFLRKIPRSMAVLEGGAIP